MKSYDFDFYEIQKQVRSFLFQNGIIPFDQDLDIITETDSGSSYSKGGFKL